MIAEVDASLLLVSYNNESWLSAEELVAMCRLRLERRPELDCNTAVAMLGLDQPRYVGARIGIHNPAGEKVGTVSHLRNTELVVAAGPADVVRSAIEAGLAAAAASGLSATEVPVLDPVRDPVLE